MYPMKPERSAREDVTLIPLAQLFMASMINVESGLGYVTPYMFQVDIRINSG